MTHAEKCAWQMYCDETIGNSNACDFWHELPQHTQQKYLDRVAAANVKVDPHPRRILNRDNF